jgi:hypothetical protein
MFFLLAAFIVSPCNNRPTYKIIVPGNFHGQVKLFHSKLTDNQLVINQYGVGYITDETFQTGFKPRVYQNGRDITKECRDITFGNIMSAGIDGSTTGPFEYLGFTIPGKTVDSVWTKNMAELIGLGIIDTSKILK